LCQIILFIVIELALQPFSKLNSEIVHSITRLFMIISEDYKGISTDTLNTGKIEETVISLLAFQVQK